jgi:hypothetical protein
MAAAVLVSDCRPNKQSVEAVWTMPSTPPASDVDPAAARPAVRGGDAVRPEGSDDGTPRGDLPETALVAPRGLWRTDERRAWQEARELGLGLVVQFWAEWSADAVRFERETLQDPEVTTAIEASYVALKVDLTEETLESREQLHRYHVYQLPMVILLDGRGREHQRFDSVVASKDFLQGLSAARARR